MSELASFSASHQIKLITPQLIDQYLSKKTKLPFGKTPQAQKTLLLNLEKILHQSIINQEEAVRQTASALRRAQSGVGRKDKPIGNLLFIGPTGVGKTALAKALALHFFGSEETMIRLDMSEFQQRQDISRLIGNQQTKTPGLLTSQIRQKPYSLVLLDEFEKAHSNILNLFLQILDEGQITDSFGQKAIFRDALIIATSNAGSNFIRQQLKRSTPMEQIQSDLLDYIQNQNIFRPELLNRFDAVVAFRSLTAAELAEVVDIFLKRLNRRLTGRLTVQLSPSARQRLAQIGQNPEFGARALERTMQDKLENLVADRILRNQVSKGQTLVVTEKMIE
jgi:ATP-dependent Clp protease ATP-binding subunit ClpA